MNAISEFFVGEKYSNDQIRFSLGVENLGGIRPSLDETGRLEHIAIMSASEMAKASKSDNPYHDRIEGNILIYTAAGRKGDQSLGGRNKRILEQYQNPIPIFGFINHGQQVYEFLGLLEVVRHYTEQQIDQSRNIRSVWVFEFFIHREPQIIPIGNAREISASILDSSKRSGLSLESEREIATTESQPISIQQTINAEEIRSKLLDLNPYKFEHLIKAVLERKGFNQVEVTRSSGDGGIDLNAIADDSQDFFAGTLVQLQAKRWRHAVGSIEVNNFRGAMSSSAKGVFITTSSYTRAAIENAYSRTKSCITLIDGLRFSSIVIQCKVDISKFKEG